MFKRKRLNKMFMILGLMFMTSVDANDVEIVKVVLTSHNGIWNAEVTLKHDDTGWEHYADAWRLVDQNGNEIARRTLHHPHVNEQPFTRTLNHISIAAKDKIIFIMAHDKKHGWSSNRVRVDLRKKSGDKYKINFR